MNSYRLLLASASPRRRELIKLITDDYISVSCDVDETVPEGTSPTEAVTMLARKKAHAAVHHADGRTVIAADTLVALDGKILGKPADGREAAEMLGMLSGSVHTVMTGVCIITPDGREEAFCESTSVEFYELTEKQIADYVASGEPMDKAGAYGIQEYGALLVRGITGDFFNVVGFPVGRINRVLENLLTNCDNIQSCADEGYSYIRKI